jgi:hypothetical protein
VWLLVRPGEVQGLVTEPSGEAIAGWLRAQLQAETLKYIADPKAFDLWCSPGATQARGGEDCDGLAVLAASIAVGLGLPTQVVVGQRGRGRRSGHVWIEGVDAAGWFLIEATSGVIERGARPKIYRPILFIKPPPSV